MNNDLQASRSPRLPIEVLMSPFVSFAKIEAAGGILLVASTIVALLWANSQWATSYQAIWNARTSIGFGGFSLTESRREWINDGLMAVFFLLMGLEMKREVLIGELSSLRRAALPLIAAIGGSMLPALFYVAIAHDSNSIKGWAIPMATDIAFVLGVLTILGKRVPVALKIFVTALAIADDLIAVLVIAIFYTERIEWTSLTLGMAGIALCFGINWLGVRKPIIYALIGLVVWYAVLKSGVHSTVAGILLGFAIPARTYVDREPFLKQSRYLLNSFEAGNSVERHCAVHALHTQLEMVESPLHRIERYLHPWVSFLIMPLFAFANSGVRFLGSVASAARHPMSLGIIVGLFVGKPLGIWLFARLSVKSGLAAAPVGLSWDALFGAAWLCGLGFTMSLFIATLAFNDEISRDMSKIGILAGSLASGICASLYLLRQSARERQSPI